MTPQELKNSILQQAIQGKLVEQRPEEGTAEELFQQIQKEKQRLIADGKIKKEKPLPEITEEEKPFEIPERWKWVRLKDIVYNRGQITPQSTFSYIDIGSIDNQRQLLNKNENIIEAKDAPSRARKIVGRGDILYATVRPYLHNVCIIDKDFTYTPIASTGFAVLTCHADIFNKYLFYYLLSPVFDSYANSNENAKDVAYPAINDDRLYRAVIAMPPLSEQKRIVAKIEELLPYIDRYEESWLKLETFNSRFPDDMKKSLLQYAIQGKLVEQRPEEGTAEELFEQIQKEKQRLIADGKIKKEKPLPEITEDEKPFDIPESWKWVRLGEIVIFQGGYAYKSTSYVATSKNQVIRLGNIKQGAFLPNEKQVFISDQLASETDQYKIKQNDILISMTGTRRKKDYFYAAIIDNNISQNTSYYLNQRVGCFRSFNAIYPVYLCYVLQCEIIREIIFKKETGTANQGNLGSEDIKRYVYIPLPPLAEQKRIVAKLEQLLPLCERLK